MSLPISPSILYRGHRLHWTKEYEKIRESQEESMAAAIGAAASAAGLRKKKDHTLER